MGRTALIAEDKDALNETIAFVDKSEGEGRKQNNKPICIVVTSHRPSLLGQIPLGTPWPTLITCGPSSFAFGAHFDHIQQKSEGRERR